MGQLLSGHDDNKTVLKVCDHSTILSVDKYLLNHLPETVRDFGSSSQVPTVLLSQPLHKLSNGSFGFTFSVGDYEEIVAKLVNLQEYDEFASSCLESGDIERLYTFESMISYISSQSGYGPNTYGSMVCANEDERFGVLFMERLVPIEDGELTCEDVKSLLRNTINMHDDGILHQDLHVRNVMKTVDHGQPNDKIDNNIRIIDYGLALVFGPGKIPMVLRLCDMMGLVCCEFDDDGIYDHISEKVQQCGLQFIWNWLYKTVRYGSKSKCLKVMQDALHMKINSGGSFRFDKDGNIDMDALYARQIATKQELFIRQLQNPREEVNTVISEDSKEAVKYFPKRGQFYRYYYHVMKALPKSFFKHVSYGMILHYMLFLKRTLLFPDDIYRQKLQELVVTKMNKMK